MTNYPTNLTDNQCKIIEIFKCAREKAKIFTQKNFDAINYLLKPSCQWRMLPNDFPPYNTGFHYFNKWKNEGAFEEFFSRLHIFIRVLLGRQECPSLGIIDSRSIGRMSVLQRFMSNLSDG